MKLGKFVTALTVDMKNNDAPFLGAIEYSYWRIKDFLADVPCPPIAMFYSVAHQY